MTDNRNLSRLIQGFFIDFLISQKQASPHTIASYRDTFRLLLIYLQEKLNKKPVNILLDDLDSTVVGAFLNYIEKERGGSTRTRNQRLAAIRSFFNFAAFKVPDKLDLIQRVLAIPQKRYSKRLIEFLNRQEIEALLSSPNKETWLGMRDHALLLFAIQTGLRVSEITQLQWENIILEKCSYVLCIGKGRKQRATPLTKQTIASLKVWKKKMQAQSHELVFPNARGKQLSTDGVQYIIDKNVEIARKCCPSLKSKKISPHVLRHTAAMLLLQSGVERSSIAIWLGHESVDTTRIYLNVDLKMKEEMLNKIAPHNTKPGRFKPDDQLMEFLNNL